MIAHLIFYVRNQQNSKEFYSSVLNSSPTLDVHGMTEFQLNAHCILGLMPESGIIRLLGPDLPDPSRGRGIPRAELYLLVENAHDYYQRAITSGATPISPVASRDWGHAVGYCLDKDGHVLAFAQQV